MNMEDVNNIAGRIADDSSENAMVKVDDAVDQIAEGLLLLSDNLDKVDLDNEGDNQVIRDTKDLLETGVNPYMLDIINKLDALEAE